jgi:hypothetical protein
MVSTDSWRSWSSTAPPSRSFPHRSPRARVTRKARAARTPLKPTAASTLPGRDGGAREVGVDPDAEVVADPLTPAARPVVRHPNQRPHHGQDRAASLLVHDVTPLLGRPPIQILSDPRF